MRWPDDLHTDDPQLADALDACRTWRDDVQVHRVLRHLRGRRITALASQHGEPVVVKLFHSERARGNHRRLTALAGADLGDLVPSSLGHDPSGRVGLIDYRPGTVFDQLPDDQFVAHAFDGGRALRRLHDSAAELDREWTLADEVDALERRSTEATAPLVHVLLRRMSLADIGPVVPSHRDCHPRQLVVHDGHVHWIDLDDCALAPAGLDVGNMAAHITREGVLGRRRAQVAAAARERFIRGYGWHRAPTELVEWELLSIARLASLAEVRHGSPAERDALVRLADEMLAGLPPRAMAEVRT